MIDMTKNSIEIRKLPPGSWKEYRNLRLEALQNDPIAFGSSYKEEKLLTESEWKKRISNVRFAVSNDRLVGMIVFTHETKIKLRHIANIYGVYVSRRFRGQGIGSKLIEAALSEIKKNRNTIKINLHVNPKQEAAVELYKNHGFKIAGKLDKNLFVDGKFYDELIMEKFI